MQSKLPHFFEIIAAGLVCGCLFSPYASAFGLAFVLAAKLAEKYYTRNLSDADRIEIQTIKTEHEKLKLKVEKDSLAKAFAR